MAQINLIHREEGAEDIELVGSAKILELMKKLEPGLKVVKQSCEEKFPDLRVEWDDLDPDCFIVEEFEDGVWDTFAWVDVRTVSSLESEPVTEFDRWRICDEPAYTEVLEYLHDADWSLIQPFCSRNADSLGDIVSVSFSVVRAVESFRGNEKFHFHHNQRPL